MGVLTMSQLLQRQDWEYLVSAGLIKGYLRERVFGYSPNVSAADGEVEIWHDTPNSYYWITTASVLTVVSTSASDTGTLIIFGLNENWELQTENVTVTGTTPVNTNNSWMRVNRCIYTNGDGTRNIGEIDVYQTSVSNVVAEVGADDGITQQCIYTCPAGYKMFVGTSLNFILPAIGSNGTKIGQHKAYIKQNAVGFGALETYELALNTTGTGAFQGVQRFPPMQPGKTDVYFTFIAESNNVRPACTFELLIVKDELVV